MIEGKVYLLKYYDYDLETMAEKVKLYIVEMKNKVK
jgi:hypothetical protein